MRHRIRLLALMCTAGALTALAAAQAEVVVDKPAPQLQSNGQNGAGPESAGRQVFMAARCFACHGEYGFGGVGPRFRENHFLGMGDYVVGQILIGRGVMPSFANALDNQQIAAVASYIRNSWGNQFGPVQADEVAKVRDKIKTQPPADRPHVSMSDQPKGAPMKPDKPLPPGQAKPPKSDQ